MIPAQLITGGSFHERKKKGKKIIQKLLGEKTKVVLQHPDLIVLESSNSIGIEEIRRFQKKLSLKPYQAPLKIGLITQAEKLTLPAQNALLKLLEEPPLHSVIILLAPQKEVLLATIVSRCQIISLPLQSQLELDEPLISQSFNLLFSVLSAGVGERLELATQMAANKKEALQLVEAFLALWRQILLAKIEKRKKKELAPFFRLELGQIKKALKDTEKVRQMLVGNVHTRLALDNLFLAYPRLSQSLQRC